MKTLNEIQGASELVEHLEMIETPAQIVSALHDAQFQIFLQLECSAEAERRLESWLTRYFEEELESIREGFGHSATLPEMLTGIVSYTESSKVRQLRLLLSLILTYSDFTACSGTILAYLHTTLECVFEFRRYSEVDVVPSTTAIF